MAEPEHSVDESEEQQVTPWKAHAAKGKSTIDYDKLIGELLEQNHSQKLI